MILSHLSPTPVLQAYLPPACPKPRTLSPLMHHCFFSLEDHPVNTHIGSFIFVEMKINKNKQNALSCPHFILQLDSHFSFSL